MIEGLWEPDNTKFSNYGGLRLYAAPGLYHLFTSLFPYMQVLYETQPTALIIL